MKNCGCHGKWCSVVEWPSAERSELELILLQCTQLVLPYDLTWMNTPSPLYAFAKIDNMH